MERARERGIGVRTVKREKGQRAQKKIGEKGRTHPRRILLQHRASRKLGRHLPRRPNRRDRVRRVAHPQHRMRRLALERPREAMQSADAPPRAAHPDACPDGARRGALGVQRAPVAVEAGRREEQLLGAVRADDAPLRHLLLQHVRDVVGGVAPGAGVGVDWGEERAQGGAVAARKGGEEVREDGEGCDGGVEGLED